MRLSSAHPNSHKRQQKVKSEASFLCTCMYFINHCCASHKLPKIVLMCFTLVNYFFKNGFIIILKNTNEFCQLFVIETRFYYWQSITLSS